MRTFEIEKIMEQVEGEHEIFERMVAIFLVNSPKVLQDLRAAVETSNAEAVMFSAHRLRSSLVNLFAAPSSETALALERMGREKDLAQASESLRTLEIQIKALTEALRLEAHR